MKFIYSNTLIIFIVVFFLDELQHKPVPVYAEASPAWTWTCS